MDVNDLFCPKCGMLKSRCVCGKKTRRQKNLEICPNEELRPLFDTEDEIIFYKCFEPYRKDPSVDLDRVNLSKELKEALRYRGIEKLYPFQKEAIDRIKRGENVVITAPTGFGKTEAFSLPVIDEISRGGMAIVLYPTKALTRDQYEKISYYSSFLGLKVVKFDGDSSYEERREVFSGKADVLLSNPDMIDYHLRNNPRFREVVKELRFLVVDELHAYSGILGTNMHYLSVRLSRFSDYRVVCSSATIANPKDFASSIFDREFYHVAGNHRKSRMHFIMRLTPSIYSSLLEVVSALRGKKVLVFGNSYRFVETAAWILRQNGIMAEVHKSGLTRDRRERVERAFKYGELPVVVSTSTLELGIDIGDVDAVISELVNYSTFVQRSGRAGRKGQDCIGILLMREEDTIAQYYKLKPEEYLRDEMHCYAEKMNEELMRYHLLSMCIEKPLDLLEIRDEWMKTVEYLVEKGFARFHGLKLFPSEKAMEFMKSFSMRGIGDKIDMIHEGKKVGERTLPVAIKELFPGSLIIHGGVKYKCIELKNTKAILEKCSKDEFNLITEPLYSSIPVVKKVELLKEDSAYCSMEITISVYGYVVKDIFNNKKLKTCYIEPVSYTFPTKGFILTAPFPEERDYEDYYAGSFHALEHVLIESSDALTGGSQHIGGISTPEGDIFVYDAVKGGSGLSKLLFERLDKAFKVAYDVLKNCDCNRIEGCPKCTYSYHCGNNNTPLNRIGAMLSAEKWLKGERRKINPEKYVESGEFVYFP